MSHPATRPAHHERVSYFVHGSICSLVGQNPEPPGAVVLPSKKLRLRLAWPGALLRVSEKTAFNDKAAMVV